MKQLFFIALLIIGNYGTSFSQDIITGLSAPAHGVKIKANFPGYTGGWSRGFRIANENDSQQFFGIGAMGGVNNGISDFSYGWIGRGYSKAFMSFLGDGKVGIGTIDPQTNLHILHGSEMTAYLRLESQYVGQNASIQFCSANTYRWELGTGISAQSAFELYDRTDGVSRFVVLDGGNIGIGTTTPDYKLDVNGTIRARELKVDMQGADFVFEKDYNLLSLSEVEEFITTNKHLPDVTPAKQMQEDGVNQSEMNQKLLQKIEELTLYVIQQNKIVCNQSQVIDHQNKKLEDYSTRLLKLENK